VIGKEGREGGTENSRFTKIMTSEAKLDGKGKKILDTLKRERSWYTSRTQGSLSRQSLEQEILP